MKTFMQKPSLEWFPLARSFVIDQQHFKYEANTSAFLKDSKFSIKVSDLLGQIARPWNVRVKKKTTTTNKQTKRTK